MFYFFSENDFLDKFLYLVYNISMMKFWVQLVRDNKLQKDMMYESDKNYNKNTFFFHLSEMCYELGIPTPVILKTHYKNFEEFNNMHFSKRDFVEPFDYDRMIIENATQN